MYPEDSLQYMLEPWWIEDKSFGFNRGRLMKAFLPHVDQVPKTITTIGRTEPTVHNKANYQIEPLRIKQPHRKPTLPVAAMPLYSNEVHTIYRAKKRPALIISEGGESVDRALTIGKPKWQTAPTVLVAPFYGADEGGQRAGFNPQFIKRVRRAMYPQFMWDKLPINGSTVESILRLDHIQPVGRHHDSIEILSYRLSDDALTALNDWIMWFIEGCIYKDCILDDYHSYIKTLEVDF